MCLGDFLCVGLSGFKFSGSSFSFFVYIYTCLCIYVCVYVCFQFDAFVSEHVWLKV